MATTWPGGADPVNTLKAAAQKNADIKKVFWDYKIQRSASTTDDFARFHGAQGSNSPIWVDTTTAQKGGDVVTFTRGGGIAGRGARGENDLAAHASILNFGTYSVKVEYWRDGVWVTQKQKDMMAARDLVPWIMEELGKKLGLRWQNDMMLKLRNFAFANPEIILRPNGRKSRDDIRTTDVLTPSFIVLASAMLKGRGAKPVGIRLSSSGSEVRSHLLFVNSDSWTDIRNSQEYQSALHYAATRGDGNPLFSGVVVPWNGQLIFEHTIVTPDVEDFIDSPMVPRAKIAEAITAGTAAFDVVGTTDAKNTSLFFQNFPGYDYKFTEDQSATPDTNTYYFWIRNPDNAPTDPGKAGFYSYTGSTGNAGDKITVAKRLGSTASGDRVTTLGEVQWDASVHTDVHPVGATVIYANKWGTPIAWNFMFGAGAAVRAYGPNKKQPISDGKDFGFVEGHGIMSVFGQGPALDTYGKARGYLLLESAVEIPGLDVPAVEPA